MNLFKLNSLSEKYTSSWLKKLIEYNSNVQIYQIVTRLVDTAYNLILNLK